MKQDHVSEFENPIANESLNQCHGISNIKCVCGEWSVDILADSGKNDTTKSKDIDDDNILKVGGDFFSKEAEKER